MVRISTITALLLLALSAIVSARAYARISEIESPISGILGAIPIGKRDYQLQSVSPLDEKLRCLGSTSLEVRNDSGTVVIVRSNVRIKVR